MSPLHTPLPAPTQPSLTRPPSGPRRLRWLLVTLSLPLVACLSGAPRLTEARATMGSSSADLAAAIARVEYGLIPEVRCEGQTGGWSIEERMHTHHAPALSIAIIDDYRVAWAKAYGLKDVRTGQRATTETLFQAASISKMVTGLAALQQVESGRVSLDADINQGLRSWKLPDNGLTRATAVTLRQLLSHTAGTNLRSVPGYPAGAALPTLHQILDGRPPASSPPIRVERAPGTAYGYSGGGSLIVQQLVIDLADRPFATAMSDAVFVPLGLEHSTFQLPLPPSQLALTATEYDEDEKVLPVSYNPESAAAGLWTTPTDLARFLIEIQLGLQGRSKRVSKQVATQMTTPVAPIGEPDVWTGLGTFVERHGVTMYFGHDGRNSGFLAISRATTTGGKGAVVMTNSAGGAPLLLEVLRSLAIEYSWDGWLKPPTKGPCRGQ